MDNALKKALEKREIGGLPSNFSYRMMEKVRLEAEKKRRKQKVMIWASLISASLAILGLLVYVLFFYLEFNIADYMPEVEITTPSGPLVGFYWYIGSLVGLLLGLDYWVRNKRRKLQEQ